MRGRRFIFAATALTGALTLAPVFFDWQPRFIWNASASVPVGLYFARPLGTLNVGDLVAVAPPQDLADFLAKRGYLPRSVPLIKHVLALPGTEVCRKGATIFVGGKPYGQARERDRLGRSLPRWQGCRGLGEGEIFLMNPDVPDSFDGRYFGPLPVTSVTAALSLLWTEESAHIGLSLDRRRISGRAVRSNAVSSVLLPLLTGLFLDSVSAYAEPAGTATSAPPEAGDFFTAPVAEASLHFGVLDAGSNAAGTGRKYTRLGATAAVFFPEVSGEGFP
ncbi:S26 family signal peptidase [Roseibium porphyridii]|uniref:S26 family signal peptidase n=1 Tax=Roseibium porphyridii TaxID=2866279 RepID=A0ABY8FCW1_9HYPH|nr:S26 family signal peptidase [Roseibium sp. KMA01]WFE92584.1 S26 family signal peptidase [Roseibium sp. KMA01]